MLLLVVQHILIFRPVREASVERVHLQDKPDPPDYEAAKIFNEFIL